MSPTSVGAADEKPIKETEGSESLAALAVHRRKRGRVLQSVPVGNDRASGFKAALAGMANLLPVWLAVVVTTIANGLLSSAMKDRLVFLRWYHALPGHRASRSIRG